MCKRFTGQTLMNDKGEGRVKRGSDRCERKVERKKDGGGQLLTVVKF